MVGSMFLLVLMLAAMVAVFWESGPSESWQAMLGKYLSGGLDFIRHTMAALERQFPILGSETGAHRQRAHGALPAPSSSAPDRILVSVAGCRRCCWRPPGFLLPARWFALQKFLARAVPNAFFERALYLLHEVDQTAHRYFQGLDRLTVLDTIVLAAGLGHGVSSPLVLG
jgi:predicted PurR-regulated permease PerM